MSAIAPALAHLASVLILPLALAAQAQPSTDSAQGGISGQLSCSPAPCVLPNVLVESGFGYYRGGPMAANPLNANALVIAGIDGSCASRRLVHVSLDRADTWRRSCLPETDDEYPWSSSLAYDHAGRLHVISGGEEAPIRLHTSLDNGLSFGTPVDAVPRIFGTNGLPTLAVDTGGASPYRGSLYIATTQTAAGGESQVWVSRSRDGGASWEHGSVSTLKMYPAVTYGSGLAVGRDGTLYLAYLVCHDNRDRCMGATSTAYLQRSTDGGWSWGWPVAALSFNLDGASFGGWMPSIAVDNSMGAYRGSVYLALQAADGVVKVVTSPDGLVSWSAPYHPGYKLRGSRDSPRVSVSATGEAGVAWRDTRYAKSLGGYDVFGVFSRDRFVNRSAEIRLTSATDVDTGYPDPGLVGSAWVGFTLFVSPDAVSPAGRSYRQWVVGAARPK